jgi:hypothetical protein
VLDSCVHEKSPAMLRLRSSTELSFFWGGEVTGHCGFFFQLLFLLTQLGDTVLCIRARPKDLPQRLSCGDCTRRRICTSTHNHSGNSGSFFLGGIGHPLRLLVLGGGGTVWPAGRALLAGRGAPALTGNEDDTPAATGHPLVVLAAAPPALSRVITDQ